MTAPNSCRNLRADGAGLPSPAIAATGVAAAGIHDCNTGSARAGPDESGSPEGKGTSATKCGPRRGSCPGVGSTHTTRVLKSPRAEEPSSAFTLLRRVPGMHRNPTLTDTHTVCQLRDDGNLAKAEYPSRAMRLRRDVCNLQVIRYRVGGELYFLQTLFRAAAATESLPCGDGRSTAMRDGKRGRLGAAAV